MSDDEDVGTIVLPALIGHGELGYLFDATSQTFMSDTMIKDDGVLEVSLAK